MATITGSSTQADIVTAYLANLSYETDGSAAKCRAFIEACRALLVMHPAAWGTGQQSMAFNPELWRKELELARQWLAANADASLSGGSSVKHLDLRGYRD